MNGKRHLWMLMAVLHLALVICGAAHWLPKHSASFLGSAVRCYGRMTGADSQFSFYAPAVGALYRSRFVLENARDASWSASLEQAKSPEAALRLQGIIECAFANGAAEESAPRRERLAKSWAAAMFNRHPRAVSLTIAVEACDVPTMAEYRAGRPPKWEIIYEARLKREAR